MLYLEENKMIGVLPPIISIAKN